MLIRGGLVLGSTGGSARADIRVEDARIVAVGPGLTPVDGEHVLDASNRLVVPGLVDAHYHSNEGFLRGSYDNLPLEGWLAYAYPFTNTIRYSERQLYLRTLLGAIELLESGTTTVVDFLYELPAPSPETLRPVLSAYRDAGIRVVLAVSVWDLPWTDTIPVRRDLLPDHLRAAVDAPTPSIRGWLDLLRATIDEWHGLEDVVQIALAPSGPQRCSDALWEALHELAEERDLAITTHCLETRIQAYTAQHRYGRSLVEYLRDLGVLDRRLSLAHGIWLTEADIELVAVAGSSVIHNPQANLKLGDGIAPLPALLRAGVNVALGTDGMSTNDTRDMYEALKLTALLHKVHDPDFGSWLGAREAWRIATEGGARAAGLGDEIGTLDPGRRADIALLDLDDIPFIPLNDPLTHLVYSLPSRSIREVLVEGGLVVEAGRVTRVDRAAVLAETRVEGERLRPRRAASHDEGPRLMPALREVHERAWARDVGAERYIGGPIGGLVTEA